MKDFLEQRKTVCLGTSSAMLKRSGGAADVEGEAYP